MTGNTVKLAISFALIAFLAGCAKAPAPPKEFILKGEVMKLDATGQLATVKGEKIEGWMEAMTMDYPVKDKQEFQKLKVGDSVNAKLMVQGTDYWISAVANTSAQPGAK